MAARRRLLFLLSIFITRMLIIFGKVSANNKKIRKIRTWRLNITDLFTKQAKDKLDVNRLKWYLIGDKLYRRHVGFSARNGMFMIVIKIIRKYRNMPSLLVSSSSVIFVRDSQARIQCDVCDKWIYADCIGLSEEECSRLGQNDEEWLCNKCK